MEEKQIEEMREDISCLERECRSYCKERKCTECHLFFARMDCQNHFIAEGLTAKGYRKASEVAEDIIRILRAAGINENRYPVIAEIKKKYTEDGE